MSKYDFVRLISRSHVEVRYRTICPVYLGDLQHSEPLLTSHAVSSYCSPCGCVARRPPAAASAARGTPAPPPRAQAAAALPCSPLSTYSLLRLHFTASFRLGLGSALPLRPVPASASTGGLLPPPTPCNVGSRSMLADSRSDAGATAACSRSSPTRGSWVISKFDALN